MEQVMFVHVRDEAEHTCRPAFVLARGQTAGGGPTRLLRVMYPTPRIEALGWADTEGWYAHREWALTATSSDGLERRLDSWHEPNDCGQE